MAAELTISEADVARIADAVAERICVAEPSIATIERVGVTFREVQTMLGAPSAKATQRRIRALGIKPYCRGNYRKRDVENAIARRSRP